MGLHELLCLNKSFNLNINELHFINKSLHATLRSVSVTPKNYVFEGELHAVYTVCDNGPLYW